MTRIENLHNFKKKVEKFEEESVKLGLLFLRPTRGTW